MDHRKDTLVPVPKYVDRRYFYFSDHQIIIVTTWKRGATQFFPKLPTPRNQGGIGMGKDGDNIELTIGKIGDARAKGWTAKKRLDMRAELAKVAELSRAIVEVTEFYPQSYNDNNTNKLNGTSPRMVIPQNRV